MDIDKVFTEPLLIATAVILEDNSPPQTKGSFTPLEACKNPSMCMDEVNLTTIVVEGRGSLCTENTPTQGLHVIFLIAFCW